MTDPDRPALRVLVVDADERTRQSLEGLIAIGRRCTVVGSAGSASEALALLSEFAPDVIVVDPRLPEVDAGRAFIARVRSEAPQTRILVMGWAGADEAGDGFGGADAFVRKTFRPNELIDAVRAAAGDRSPSR